MKTLNDVAIMGSSKKMLLTLQDTCTVPISPALRVSLMFLVFACPVSSLTTSGPVYTQVIKLNQLKTKCNIFTLSTLLCDLVNCLNEHSVQNRVKCLK